MWYQTKISELLGIRYPILQGPMGGGFSSADLLAIVSNAGGLGSFGAYTLTPEQIREADQEIKSKTNLPYNINLWVSDVDDDLKDVTEEEYEKVFSIFKPYFDELKITKPGLSLQIPSKFEKQVEMVLKIKPAVFSFIFGVPDTEILKECKRSGMKTIGSATTLDEALLLEQAGVDAIIAAGFEAGGHRPSFLKPATDSLTGTFALIQQLKFKLKTPVIAAGGIVDGQGIAAALKLGADAVQIGTAFLGCDESNATDLHKSLLHSEVAKHTVLSKLLTGRLGRMLCNRITEELKPATETLPFPLHGRLMASLKEAALAQHKNDLVNFWCGQGAYLLRHSNAKELMNALIVDTEKYF